VDRLAFVLMLRAVIPLWPQRVTNTADKITSAEAEELNERDLAHWLASTREAKVR